MTAYIDLHSLGPTEALARTRAVALGLSGTLLPQRLRDTALRSLKSGDSIICQPSAFPYWRRLAPEVLIVHATDTTQEDGPANRVSTWLEWHLIQLGMSSSDAKVLVRTPPKTDKHKYKRMWDAAQALVELSPVLNISLNSIKDLETIGSTERIDVLPYTWKLVREDKDYEDVASSLVPIWWDGPPLTPIPIGIDTETVVTGSTPNETKDILVGIGLAFGDKCFYGEASDPRWMALLKECLPKRTWVGWNAKYDCAVLLRHGIIPGPLHGDGMLAAYLAGEPRAGLKDYILRTYGIRMIQYDDVTGGGSILDVPPEDVARYCCGDAYWALKGERDLVEGLTDKAKQLYDSVDLPMVQTIVDMELAGIKLDRESAQVALKDTTEKLDALDKAINILALDSGFMRPDRRYVCRGCHNGKNKKRDCKECKGVGVFHSPQPIMPGSSAQLVEWLHRHLGISIQAVSQKTGQPSVSALALLRMQHEHPAISLLVRWRGLEKYKEFLEGWVEDTQTDSRIHTTFTNAYVRSGRISSRDPNLTQVSLLWRGHFVAEDGKILLAADYQGLELRCAAFSSRDPLLMKIVNNDPDTYEGDLHAQNVHKLFHVPYEDQGEYKVLRTRAKNFMFGALYGSKGQQVQEVLEKLILQDPSLGEPPTLRETTRSIQELTYTYVHYFREWVPFAIQRMREQKNTSYTAFGRPRILPDLVSGDKSMREAAERAGINHILQGTAADITRMACNAVSKLEGGRLLLQVHDELLSEVNLPFDRYETAMVSLMCLDQPLEGVPLMVDVGVGQDWQGTHNRRGRHGLEILGCY
ncbi:hypothetical protein LCGC14_0409960 [marine sediment metagenome]|uniref:DNA-directed DNA polymerase family A palm domain-containing protein n=1 Tax=marine sediment metagenome TaxID=412755 RepID=A0A0F9TC18_9ZZZZ